MGEVTVITNNVPRDIIDAWELGTKERAAFDYLDWDKIEKGEDSASFIRYKGELYDLGDFMRVERSGYPIYDWMNKWDGYISDTFFSGILVRYYGIEHDQVIMGRFYG